MSLLHALTGLIGLCALCTYTLRTGRMIHEFSRSELTARGGLASTLAFVVAGITTRAFNNDPFAWFHWGLLVGLTVTLVGYLLVIVHRCPIRSCDRRTKIAGRDVSWCAKRLCSSECPLAAARSYPPCPSTTSSPTRQGGESSSGS